MSPLGALAGVLLTAVGLGCVVAGTRSRARGGDRMEMARWDSVASGALACGALITWASGGPRWLVGWTCLGAALVGLWALSITLSTPRIEEP